MLTDPIANFLNSLKTASSARKESISVRRSIMIASIAELLKTRRFIDRVETEDEGLRIYFRNDRDPLMTKRVSKPGQRIYVGFDKIKRVRSGLGLAIISTSKGILSGDEAVKQKTGGEYLCEIY